MAFRSERVQLLLAGPQHRRNAPESTPKHRRKYCTLHYCTSLYFHPVSRGLNRMRIGAFRLKASIQTYKGARRRTFLRSGCRNGGLKAISGIRRGGLGFGTDGLAAGGQPNASQGQRSTRTQQAHRKLLKSYWKRTRNPPETFQKDCHHTLRAASKPELLFHKRMHSCSPSINVSALLNDVGATDQGSFPAPLPISFEPAV